MTMNCRRAIVCAAAVISVHVAVLAAQKPPAASGNPELVGQLAKELGSTPAQAEGAAGSLFGLAKSRLSAGDFSKVEAAVPGMNSLLKAAPPLGGSNPLSAVTGTTGSIGGLATVASAFSKLGLKPELVSKAIPVITQYVTKSGGPGVASLLEGALK